MHKVRVWAIASAVSIMVVILAEAVWLLGFRQMPQLLEIFWVATVLRLLVVAFLLTVVSRPYPKRGHRLIFVGLLGLAVVHLFYPVAETLVLALHATGLVAGLTPNFLHFGLVWLIFGVPGVLLAATTYVFRRQGVPT